jgi:glutathione synthase/RimK-type ligase-like ATP-grasp enzyme
MLDCLRKRGADAELLDSRWFPGRCALTFDPLRGAGNLRLPAGRTLGLETVRAVYWRSYPGVAAPRLPDDEQSFIAANDARSLFESLLIHLPARWVNGWRAFQLHQTKPVQLAMAAALGAPVPETVLTNDPDAVEAFAARHGRSIFKPVQGGAHTRRLTAAHLAPENLAHLACAPVTLQEEVPGTNLRVFVAGDELHCCEIRTDAIDFREDDRPRLLACDMPEDLRRWSRQIAARLELVWTGMDWRRAPDGRHFFLEANPSPMFLGFEEATGLPLTESLTRLLLEETP